MRSQGRHNSSFSNSIYLDLRNYKHIETKLVHSGEPSPRILGAVSMPIFQTAMFETMGEKNYDDIKYIRLKIPPTIRPCMKSSRTLRERRMLS